MEAAETEMSQVMGRAGAGFRAIPGQVKRRRLRGGVGGGGGRSLMGSAWSWPGWRENRRRWGSGLDAGCGATPHLSTRNYVSGTNENKEQDKEKKQEERREKQVLQRESEELCLYFNISAEGKNSQSFQASGRTTRWIIRPIIRQLMQHSDQTSFSPSILYSVSVHTFPVHQ